MDVFRAVVPHGSEVEMLQNVQGLLEHRSLGPGVVARYLIPLETAGNRRGEFTLVIGEVVHAQEAADPVRAVNEGLGDRSPVKLVPSRLQPC